MAQDPICGMTVNEKKARKTVHEGQEYYFCSQHCLEKFAKNNNISEKTHTPCSAHAKNPFYENKTFIVAAALIFIVLLSYFLPLLIPFRESLFMYFSRIWWAILLGLFIGGVVDHYVPREYVSHILASPKKRTILYSVVLGFFMSACSHGILALSIELHKKGASTPSVVAFLLASPWANFTLTIMLIGFFGLKALYIILSAILIAITTGLIFQVLERMNLIERNINSVTVDPNFSIIKDIKKRSKGYRSSLQPGASPAGVWGPG